MCIMILSGPRVHPGKAESQTIMVTLDLYGLKYYDLNIFFLILKSFVINYPQLLQTQLLDTFIIRKMLAFISLHCVFF